MLDQKKRGGGKKEKIKDQKCDPLFRQGACAPKGKKKSAAVCRG